MSEYTILEKSYDLLIDGNRQTGSSETTLPVVDPATGTVATTLTGASAADVTDAVKAADEATTEWAATDPDERGRVLQRIARLIRANEEKLARIQTLENGMPISVARGDAETCARYFEYYAGAADKIHGDSIPHSHNHTDFTVREPLGVTVQILPWNFPLGIFGRSIAPALAAGNVCVVKPSEETPIGALTLGELATEAGLPEGVLNVVPGDGAEAGATLTEHPLVDAISFTGSNNTGQLVARSAIENITPVHLELGGKNPNVVFPDADLESAVENTIRSIFTLHSGQTCSAGDRLIVHEDVHDEFIDLLVERTAALTVGPGIEDHDVSPIVSQRQFESVMEYVEMGIAEAREPLIGGGSADREGYFVEPTIFDGVTSDMTIAQEEIFGPVLPVLSFSSEEEAIELANDTRYGLVAGVFTDSLDRAHRFYRDVEAGQVYVNEWFAGGVETPFGGTNESGYGREKGLAALEEYTQLKNVCFSID